MNCRTCGHSDDAPIESREALWQHLNNATTQLQMYLIQNNVIQAYFQWEQIYYYTALLKNTEESK